MSVREPRSPEAKARRAEQRAELKAKKAAAKRGICPVKGCVRPVWTGGLCDAHYQQKIAGKPFTPPRDVRSRNRSVILPRITG